MRGYVIKTYRREETEKVLNVLKTHDVEILKVNSSIEAFESVTFICKKEVWKMIKDELNLTITSIFSKIKTEP